MKAKHFLYICFTVLLLTMVAGVVESLRQSNAAFAAIFTSFFWLLVFLIATVNDELN